LFALATGTKHGETKTVAATVLAMPEGGMGGSTGVPMAIGLALFANGAIANRGVFAPEMAIEPDLFFDALASFCTPAKTGVEDMVLVTTSQ
jgi:saccharopine dehydrogenase-like NADP-dependent oxidoreductase